MEPKNQLPTHFQDWNTPPAPSPSMKTSRTVKPQKPIYKRPWVIVTAAAIIAAIIIAIVVPLAVILPKKSKAPRHAAVMLPLYIYPQTNATWAPLYSSLSARPDLKFTVIINPSSGPGSSQYPDEHYTAALTQLANYSNVEKVGYVRTGYASRNLSDVISELNVYAGWASKGQALAMDGIFFDEAPHQFTQEAVDFMLSASRAVKDGRGFQHQKIVIRNPGVIPDGRFADPNTDINVVFEQAYEEYKLKESDLSTLDDDRSRHCYMVHSLPAMDQGELRGFVDKLSRTAKHLFVTNNSEQYYEQFGGDWSDFTGTVPV